MDGLEGLNSWSLPSNVRKNQSSIADMRYSLSSCFGPKGSNSSPHK